MIIRGATEREIYEALETANLKFEGNLAFDRIYPEDEGFRLTLRVKDSKGPGHRIGFSGRRLVRACWHAHGTFFDALPTTATIRTGRRVIHPGDAWEDFNIGSIIYPFYYSEACECE